MGLISSRASAPKAIAPARPLPATLEGWQREMHKAHDMLAHKPDNDGSNRGSWRCPAQRCIPDHLSGALAFLSSTEFAAAVATCSSWHAAGELLSAWPDHAPMAVPGAAARATIESSWLAFFTQRRVRGGPASSRGLFAATRTSIWHAGPEQLIPAAACSTRLWRHATEATLGSNSSWMGDAGHEGFRAALLAVAALTRIKLIRLSSEYIEADVKDALALLAPKLEMLVCPDYQAPKWLSSIPQLTHLRVLSLWYPLLSNPVLVLSRLHRLEHLSVTACEDEDDWDDDGDEDQLERKADEFATQLGLTIRTLSTKHALRSCQLAISGHRALFDVLTAPPCAANRWSPLPLLTSLNCDTHDYNGSSQSHRVLQLPSLTELHVVNDTPLSALWPDAPRHDRPQGTPAELAQAARALAQLHTLSRECSYGPPVSLTAADLAPLRHCSSLRVLQDFLPASQLEEVVSALEEAAAAGVRVAATSSSSSSSSAAPSHAHSRLTRSTSRSASFIAASGPVGPVLSSSALLERVCVFADASLPPSALAPLHRLRRLRQLVFRPPRGSSANWLEQLLEGLAGHPSIESIQILGERYARRHYVVPHLTARGLRAIIATPSLVRIDVGEDRTMDFNHANAQVMLLSFNECTALRHVCFHFSASRDGRVGWARLTSDGNGTFRWAGAEGFAVKRSYANAIIGAAFVLGVGLVAEWWRRRAAAADV